MTFRRFARPEDYIDYYVCGMVGYWATRQRLATRPGRFGRWERISTLLQHTGTVGALRLLGRWLPPECIAPGNVKMRSPIAGTTIHNILLCLDDLGTDYAMSARTVLDWPAETINARAALAALRRMVGVR